VFSLAVFLTVARRFHLDPTSPDYVSDDDEEWVAEEQVDYEILSLDIC
jgi:hypothetical protein